MRPVRMCAAVAASVGAFLAFPSLAGGPNDPDTTARTLVEQCASVQKGEAVLITGRATQAPLLEAIALQVRKAGAFPLISYTSDRLETRMLEEVPAAFDNQTNEFDMRLAGIVQTTIDVSSDDNPALMENAPPARLAARSAAMQAVEKAYLKNNVRRVSLGNGMFPTNPTAKMYGMDREQLSQVFWAGVNTDYAMLQSTGAGIKSIIESGKTAHITNPNGTDITFKISGRQCYVSDGVITKEDLAKGGPACQVWLPAGEIYAAPVPGTATGRVVVDRAFYLGKEIRSITLEFKDGKLTSFTGGKGFEPLKALYDAAGPCRDEFAFFDIGINPDVKISAGSSLLSWMPAGMVSVGIGSNTWAGGANNCGYSFSGFLPGSTLMIDEKTIVAKGMLRN